MWQKSDGGEMTFEAALKWCEDLILGGFTDWRLPTAHELFSINHFDRINPALNTLIFVKSSAQYWWSSETKADDSTRIWVVNAGGGIGAHSRSETLSEGGTKLFHVRAVRNPVNVKPPEIRFIRQLNGTVSDKNTGLTWYFDPGPAEKTWEESLLYSAGLTFAGKNDWRVPNIKELQSLNDVSLCKPSLDVKFFPDIGMKNYWSSTSLTNEPDKAWISNTEYGTVTQHPKE